MQEQLPKSQQYVQQRINHLKQFIQDERIQLNKRIKKIKNQALNGRKYKDFRNVIEQKIRLANKFIESVSEIFFTMIGDEDYLQFVSEIDIVQKLQKFNKNLVISMQKLCLNLISEQKKNEKQFQKILKPQSQKQEIDNYGSKNKPIKKKSKNSKLASQTSMKMMEWLLKNFENPYPTMEQKIKMSKQGDISIIKVNNWFINARQRTIKSYFHKYD